MSTPALTYFYSRDGKRFVSIYAHWDGYPEGWGAELARVVLPLRVVNGLSEMKGVANGPECLAAQVVAAVKKEPGNIYLYGPDANVDADYIYHVRISGERPFITYQESADGPEHPLETS